MAIGAQLEDTLTSNRSLNHFYNPRTGRPLTVLGFQLGQASPDWALAQPSTVNGQEFSYWNARQYLIEALTQPREADRKRAFGRAFQILGHVVHHLQDMAQPQHVRNDPHCDDFFWCFGPAYSPSLYEKWSEAVQETLITDPAAVGYSIDSLLFTSAFNSPMRFWHTMLPGTDSPATGSGIAEFTHSNFVSAGTNFLSGGGGLFPNPSFPLPTPSAIVEKRQITDPDLLGRNQPLRGEIWFIPTSGTDNFTGATVSNPRASTFSIFSEDLRARTGLRTTTLNRFNFRAAHEHLIPRAVAYSAGMINYFFRGKIDFVPDPSNSGQYLIRNLGSEPMKGKFNLYYDDQVGNRNPVRDAGGQALVWDTVVILAAAEGVLAAGRSVPVPGIIPPSSPPPKTPGEYMLVFSGDMGEEKAEGGSVGAVVGKLIRNEYKGALYVVGVDANGVIASLRADKDGTKVLYGWDISKRNANNPNGVYVPPATNVFDPLGFLYGNSIAKPVRDKIHAYKQVEYGPGPVEYEAKSLTLMSPDNLNAFRSHYGPGLGRVSFGQVIWAARSPDDQIGTFEFQIVNIRNVGRDADLQFTRRFKEFSGVSRVEIGGTSMPTLTFPFSYQLINGSSDPLNPGFPLVISDDGQTIKGFATFGSLNTRIHARIVISLAQTPQVRLEQTTIAPIVSESGSFLTPPYQPAAPCSVDFRRAPDGVPITTISNGFVRNRSNSYESRLTEEVLIGNVGGRIATYMREQLAKRTEVVDESTCYAEGSDFDPATGLQRRKYSIRNTVDNDVKISGGTFERFVGGDYSLPSPNVPIESISIGQLKGGYPGSPFICRDCRWSEIYDGFDPVPSVQITQNPGLAFRREEVGRTVVRALTERHADVIYGESASDNQAFIRKFRNIILTGKEYVADSSPLGEVFFATSDKSTIIHEPVQGGMPQVRIPENVVKLLAVVWM
jgi:hypothetical protein